MVNQVFALKNTKRPVQAGVWALFFNALAGGVLAYYFGVSGLAAGLSIATFVQFVVLLFWLRRSLESCLSRAYGELLRSGCRHDADGSPFIGYGRISVGNEHLGLPSSS